MHTFMESIYQLNRYQTIKIDKVVIEITNLNPVG